MLARFRRLLLRNNATFLPSLAFAYVVVPARGTMHVELQRVNLQLMVIHELLDIVYLCAKLVIAESCNNEPNQAVARGEECKLTMHFIYNNSRINSWTRG